MRRHLAKVLLPRCVAALLAVPISMRSDVRDGTDANLASRSMASASMRMCCRGSISRTSCANICN